MTSGSQHLLMLGNPHVIKRAGVKVKSRGMLMFSYFLKCPLPVKQSEKKGKIAAKSAGKSIMLKLQELESDVICPPANKISAEPHVTDK